MPLNVGATFAGFRILRLLGSGGMGEVYLAEHPRLPRREALKVLPADVSSDPDFRVRFEREADLASRLRNPHVVTVHDRGECEGRLWISMDYVDGLDAARLLTESYPSGMPVELVCTIVTAIAGALDDAHSRGLLHRDVKPANIMVSRADSDGQQRVLLTDFGIAREAGEISGLTATNMVVGTVAYSAPEQLMGAACDGRADQYALAATTYQLLTGVPLFAHPNPTAVISQHLGAPPPAVSDRRPECAALDPVLRTALAKVPEQRYPSGTDFARALRDAAASRWIEASPPPPRSGGHRAMPWLIGTAVAVVLALIGVLVAVWNPDRSADRETKSSATEPFPTDPWRPSVPVTPVVLPADLPADSGCQGPVVAQHDIDHRYLGPVRIFLTNSYGEGAKSGCIAAVTATGQTLPPIHVGVYGDAFAFPSPATDATGNTFVNYNPGRYDGVIALIPSATGFEDIGWRDPSSQNEYIGRHAYYYAELIGPDSNGQYIIRQSSNDCVPDCAGGTITHQDLRWNGSDYAS